MCVYKLCVYKCAKPSMHAQSILGMQFPPPQLLQKFSESTEVRDLLILEIGDLNPTVNGIISTLISHIMHSL